MNLGFIVHQLDAEFDIENIPPDEPFRRLLPKLYDAARIDFRRYMTAQFLRSFHGLMLENGDSVSKVYLAVFLSGEILDKIFSQGISDTLFFLHHPMDMESGNRGFLPLEERYLAEMRRRRISVYSLHSPLDIHQTISTGRAIAKALKLQDYKEYSRCSVGFAGIFGSLEEKIPFHGFIERVKAIFNINDVHFIQRLPDVYRIGIIAGGGAEVEYIKETIDAGCDTYLSGDFLNKVKTENSLRHRAEFEAIKDSLPINLVECSHYATEKLVLVNEMQDYFNKLGLETEFIGQSDPWK